MPSPYFTWDCETGPDITKAKAIMPEFSAEDVKVGNLTPPKAAEKIEAARLSHEADWISRAALRPETCNVLAIGLKHGDETTILHVNANGGEASMIKAFWQIVEDVRSKNGILAGWNIEGFDVPVMILRSRILGIPVPANLRRGRYLNADIWLDLMAEWICGRQRTEVKASLGYVARALGVGEKSGDGKDFAATYAQDEAKALAYLRNDIALTAGVGAKLGF